MVTPFPLSDGAVKLEPRTNGSGHLEQFVLL